MKVAVIGMRHAENNISRHVEKYGCEVAFVPSDRKVKFPTDVAICIIVTGAVRHFKYYDAKEFYKNVPTLFAQRGFSEIKERFEDLLFELKEQQMPEANRPKVFTNTPAIQLAAPVAEETQPQPQQKDLSNERSLRKPRDERIFEIVKECMVEGFSAKDTAKYLHAEGFFKSGGREYSDKDIFSMRVVSKRREAEATGQPAEKRSYTKKIAAPKVEVTSKQQQEDPLSLIDKVLNAAMGEREKLGLITRIRLGEIKSAETYEYKIQAGDKPGQQVLCIIKTDITHPSHETTVKLTKVQAALVVHASEKIINFITKGTIE